MSLNAEGAIELIKMIKGLPKFLVTVLLLAFFAGTNHCLLENLLGSFCQPTQECDVDGAQHQHGAPCPSSVMNAATKTSISEQLFEIAPDAALDVSISFEASAPLISNSSTGLLDPDCNKSLRQLVDGLAVAANAPPFLS